MQITLNGKSASVVDGVKLGEVIDMFAVDRRGVAVALNGEVVKRGDWDSQVLIDRDAIEILSIAAGG
ncbi:MAG: sulfur carrier protein ThiS [Actinomycetota bacterium]|nr:sulfur carrier protein ThiS [Actinomycetota bacterium]